MRCWKIPKGYSFDGSNVSDYINIVEITSTQRYTRLAQNRFPEQKMSENDRMVTAGKAVTSIRLRNDIEKSTWRTHRYFVYFESRIHVEISTSNRCHNFHVGFYFQNRWNLDEQSMWNIDNEPMANQQKCAHWVPLKETTSTKRNNFH